MTNKKTLALGAIGLLIIIAGITYGILKGVNAWFETNRFVFKVPVEMTFNKPLSIEEKEVATHEIIRVMEQIPHPEDLETDVEKYIYEASGWTPWVVFNTGAFKNKL